MKRQGLITTPRELRLIAKEIMDEMGVDLDMDRKIQLNIINKEGLSDTWGFEK